MKQMDDGCPHMPIRGELSHPVQKERKIQQRIGFKQQNEAGVGFLYYDYTSYVMI